MRVIEVPITTPERKTGKSFISWRYPLRVILAMLRTYVHVKPLRAFFTTGLFFVALGVHIGVLWLLGMTTLLGDATATILVLLGLQIMIFGLLADIVSRRR